MKPLKSLAGVISAVALAMLMSAPAYAGPGGGHGGHGGVHSGHSSAKASGKSSRASHYGARSRSSSHARSGFHTSHTSRYSQSRALRPVATNEHLVSGYYRRDGRFVQPYFATNPDSTRNNNYSTRGNVNPHTGAAGTKPRDGE